MVFYPNNTKVTRQLLRKYENPYSPQRFKIWSDDSNLHLNLTEILNRISKEESHTQINKFIKLCISSKILFNNMWNVNHVPGTVHALGM